MQRTRRTAMTPDSPVQTPPESAVSERDRDDAAGGDDRATSVRRWLINGGLAAVLIVETVFGIGLVVADFAGFPPRLWWNPEALSNPDWNTAAWLLVATILVVNVLRRPPPASADNRWWVWLVCGVSAFHVLLFEHDAETGKWWWTLLLVELATDTLLIYLGRSFSILPARRTIRVGFLYRIVRHPIYAGYLLMSTAYTAIAFSWWNLAVLGISCGLFALRARLEERVLAETAAYRSYMQHVRWRLLPGVY